MSADRITQDVERGEPITIVIDGQQVACFAGETIATAMLAAGLDAFRTDQRGKPRGLLCNMGSCYECLVTDIATGRRIRACLAPAADGMEVSTRG
ncbi:(2Fe-2S)-binding protein [Blastomonas sp.]|uniref:(2Fe-2S)-binding protein n=1 Tax=Blastomonas sp. TaxID=1909299 RepID=UPI0026050760|nr:(2Fe-2S)-binding protein [Blastomonas sp.]MDM7955708.1 (2Fe-2S)-binding protein [Blastomonas sp.]